MFKYGRNYMGTWRRLRQELLCGLFGHREPKNPSRVSHHQIPNVWEGGCPRCHQTIQFIK